VVKIGGWLVAVGACAALVACGANRSTAPAAPTTAMPEATAPGMTLDPRAQIEALDREIDAGLAELNVSPPVPACVAAATCSQLAPEPMATQPAVQDPACQPGSSDVCTDTCTLSGSICENAKRICELARDLGGTDAYANEKCAKGNASCEAARERCCSCV